MIFISKMKGEWANSMLSLDSSISQTKEKSQKSGDLKLKSQEVIVRQIMWIFLPIL